VIGGAFLRVARPRPSSDREPMASSTRAMSDGAHPTATPTVSDAFYAVLRHHGVRAVFGNPGSNELTFLKGLPQDVPYYLALQEGAAIAMADGFAQASGTPAFVNLHAASGTGNGIGCLTNTASGHTPMVILAGQQSRRYVPVDALLTNVDPTTATAGRSCGWIRPDDSAQQDAAAACAPSPSA
jgi:hypothetical protein